MEAGGAMGWVALGPDEVYRPDYRVSETYARQLNATNVNQTVINNYYAGAERRDSVNQFRNARAAVVVRSDAFAGGAPVQRAVVPVSAQAMATAPVASPASRPAPTLEARSGVGARAAPGGRRAGAISAPPPPQNLQAVRRAVIARPAGAFSPPAMPGANRPPPLPQPGATSFVAPSQLRHPETQARQPAPVAHPTAPLAPAPGVTTPRAIPLRSLPKAAPAEGGVPSPAGPPRRFERPLPGPPAGQQSGQPVGPGAQPGPDAGTEMRARAAAQERARMRQQQLRLQQEQGAGTPQQRNPQPQPLRTQPDQRRPQTGMQPAEPAKSTPPSRPKYRVGPDGKPIPVPPDENPRP